MLTPSDERRRLADEQAAVVAEVAAIEVSAYSSDSTQLLRRCREVMEVVLRHGEEDWPDLTGWQRELPQWFVAASGPERSADEEQEWQAWLKSQPTDQQDEIEDRQPWALSDWLEWLRPSERTWYWLGASEDTAGRLLVWLDVDGWPAPVGALEWLLKAAGATEIETSG